MLESSDKVSLQQHLKSLNEPLTIDDLIEILGSTVKHDDENKAITFLIMLLTYTTEDQTNLGFLAESSTGKSYIPLELSWYFPPEDVIKLGYASPTAFFHEYGVALPDPDDKRDIEEEKKRKIIHVCLEQKILIFLDQPHDQLLQRLRSLLSHDEKNIILKITDKREKYGLKTKTVVIEGYPTVLFCTARFSLADQEKTRLLLLSPEITQEKLRESILLKIERESDREAFNKRMMEDPQRLMLRDRVDQIRAASIKHIKIPEEKRNEIFEAFMECHKCLIPRHQRDISRLLALIKAHALLNFMHRKREGDAIIVNDEDVQAGFRLYSSVSEANELGLSPELFRIYRRIKPYITQIGITIADFQNHYFKEYRKRIGYEDARRILKTLSSVGLLMETLDDNDRRIRRYTLFELGVNGKTRSESYPQAEKSIVSEKYSSEVGGKPEDSNIQTLPHSPQQNISVPEVYACLRDNFKAPFLEHQVIQLIAKLRNCTPEEAERIFEILVEEGKVFRDPSGYWCFP